jgi:hypothetical protein
MSKASRTKSGAINVGSGEVSSHAAEGSLVVALTNQPKASEASASHWRCSALLPSFALHRLHVSLPFRGWRLASIRSKTLAYVAMLPRGRCMQIPEDLHYSHQ